MLDANHLPLYQRLRDFLVEKIEAGEWRPDHQLPGERQLTAEFGVSRATVRQAMQLLENQGLIQRRQGRGTYVARPKFAYDLLSPSEYTLATRFTLHTLRSRPAP